MTQGWRDIRDIRSVGLSERNVSVGEKFDETLYEIIPDNAECSSKDWVDSR